MLLWTQYLQQITRAAQGIPDPQVHGLARALTIARDNHRTVYTCGNGGSAANASHLAQDLSKAAHVRSLCLNDSIPSLTAWANDNSYTQVFSQPLKALGRSGDLLIAISGSGNSENVLNAVRVAHELDMRTWGVTGFDGGELKERAHRSVHVPCNDMGQVEAVHAILFHWLIDAVREGLSIVDSPEAVR